MHVQGGDGAVRQGMEAVAPGLGLAAGILELEPILVADGDHAMIHGLVPCRVVADEVVQIAFAKAGFIVHADEHIDFAIMPDDEGAAGIEAFARQQTAEVGDRDGGAGGGQVDAEEAGIRHAN